MKSIVQDLVIVAVACAFVLTVGCSTTGGSKGSSALAGMDAAADEVDTIVAQTAATLGALSNLVSNPSSDLQPQFKALASATKKLASQSQKVDKRMDDMDARAQAYFEEWETQAETIQNENLRNISERRREEVALSFKEVAESLGKSKAAFDPFVASLKDIQTALSLDLTKAGIFAVSNLVAEAYSSGAELKGALADAASDIRKLAAEMSSTTPQEPEQ